MKKEILITSPGKTLITLTPDTITISRKGMLNTLNHGLKGEKTIQIRNITAVQIKKPGLSSGYIQFSLSGGNESKGALYSAATDENTVMFTKKFWDQMQMVKTFVEDRQAEYNRPAAATVNSVTEADQILAYKNLLDQGIINEVEFELKKKQILGL